MIHFKSERGGKTATEQADEFVSQDSVRGISVSIYDTEYCCCMKNYDNDERI